MDLAALQRALQRQVLEGDTTNTLGILGGALAPEARLGIYVHGYRSRLVEVLGTDYPALGALLGEPALSALALDYLGEHPSSRPSVRWFGAALASHLGRREPGRPWLAELAAFEWAMGEAFDAAEAAPLGLECLAALPGDHWPGLGLRFHPSLRVLSLAHDVPGLWRRLRAGTPCAADEAPGGPAATWLVWREDNAPVYRPAAEDEAVLLECLRAGGRFAEGCERLGERLDAEAVPLRAASLLKTWITEGLVVALPR